MKPRQIPIDFISQRVALAWKEALWGYERQLLGWSDIVNLARTKVTEDSANELEHELASLTKSDAYRVSELLRELATMNGSTLDDTCRQKWLYVVLAWLFENRFALPDPFEQVESTYADFDYPKEIESFVRYMPVVGDYNPLQHTQKENEERLLANWEKYLGTSKIKYGCKKGTGIFSPPPSSPGIEPARQQSHPNLVIKEATNAGKMPA